MKPIKKPFVVGIYSFLLVLILIFTACKGPMTPDLCDHDWEYVETILATETEDGYEVWECLQCGDFDAHRFSGEYATGTAGLAYTLINEDAEYSVARGTVTSGAVAIPAFYREDENSEYLPVTEIATSAFSDLEEITSVTIPASVKTIGNGAFSFCSDLTTVTFAAGSQLEALNYTFYGSGITAIEIPASVKTIGFAFWSCSDLKTVTFAPDSQLETIDNWAFMYSGITSITLPEGLKEIGDAAFQSCTSLGSINIPASVTEIGNTAFMDCEILATVTFAPDSQLETIDYWAFTNSGITSITLPEGLMKIDNSAFQSCTSLGSITIPASVTYVGQAAFGEWTSEQTITVLGHADEKSADDAWGGADWWRAECEATIIYNTP